MKNETQWCGVVSFSHSLITMTIAGGTSIFFHLSSFSFLQIISSPLLSSPLLSSPLSSIFIPISPPAAHCVLFVSFFFLFSLYPPFPTLPLFSRKYRLKSSISLFLLSRNCVLRSLVLDTAGALLSLWSGVVEGGGKGGMIYIFF